MGLFYTVDQESKLTIRREFSSELQCERLNMNPFTPEGFWNKAVLFLNRATEPTENRSEDERRLWASFALEQTAKWALAEISPALVVDPVNDGGNQLLYALNLKEASRPVTAPAKTIFDRCSKIFRPFNFGEAKKVAAARNDYLHGPGLDIVRLPDKVWWPKFWSLMNILLTARDRTFEDLVDYSCAAQIATELERNERLIAEEFEARITAAETRLRRIKAGAMTRAEVSGLQQRARPTPIFTYVAEAICPVCERVGSVGADDEIGREVVWECEGPVVEVSFYPDHFYCSYCFLTLDRYELIELSDLNEEFLTVDDPAPYDLAEYGND